jgi:antitoxin VapB
MALHITDEETDRLVRQLARARGVGITQAVRLAVEAELRRPPLRERLKPLLEEVAATAKRNKVEPVKDWKAFYDSLED